jgi:hypothetical protein
MKVLAFLRLRLCPAERKLLSQRRRAFLKFTVTQLKQPVDPPDEILKKYSFDTSARQVYGIIYEYSKK